MMPCLSQLKKGQSAVISAFDENELEFQTLLMGIGLLPGDSIEVISESFLGSPMTIKHGAGEILAIRTKQAKLIKIQMP